MIPIPMKVNPTCSDEELITYSMSIFFQSIIPLEKSILRGVNLPIPLNLAPAYNAPTARNAPPSKNNISLKTRDADLSSQRGNNFCKNGR